ncbi:MAG TPA: TetR/AcrR family transcriptional regulator [Candidatus Dormibacteraeota bacterium]|nr:TetR/AcrR family transcriptional regulator [Candidatus Dormibacteraeota bacterium]
MPPRKYDLGRRQDAVDRNRAAILAAARELLAAGGLPALSVGAVSSRAGVSRLTVYNRFGSKGGLLTALAGEARRGVVKPLAPDIGDPRGLLRQRIAESCALWASDPALFRRLPEEPAVENEPGVDRALAERLAASDQLRPGCSLKEAEDVIGALTSFPTFDRLHKDGRRSPSAVAEILMRLAAAILS